MSFPIGKLWKAMTGSSSSSANTACAACKYQRRKCSPDCPLSPYFPPDQPKRFANVHKLFGVSNLLRLLKHVEPSKREDTVKSIAYEADTREKDPVHGCLGVITVLQNQVAKLKDELHVAREQLFFIEQQVIAADYGHESHHGLPTSPFEDEESQFLRHHVSFPEDHKVDTKLDPKLNILPLDYRYGGDDAMKAEQVRRVGSYGYFGTQERAFDESPVSHHQMHLQAALDQDHAYGALRSSPTHNSNNSSIATGYEVSPKEPADIKPGSFGGDSNPNHEEFRRAGVYLSLTNQPHP